MTRFLVANNGRYDATAKICHSIMKHMHVIWPTRVCMVKSESRKMLRSLTEEDGEIQSFPSLTGADGHWRLDFHPLADIVNALR